MENDGEFILPHEANANILAFLIYKEVKVKMITGSSFTGWVKSLDPITKSLLLVNFEEETSIYSDVLFLPGINIESIQVLCNEISTERKTRMDESFCKKEVTFTSKMIRGRMEALGVWLSDNRVPYSITDDKCIKVLEVATIAPPYEVDSIQCKNEIVLDKVVKLIQSAPGFQLH